MWQVQVHCSCFMILSAFWNMTQVLSIARNATCVSTVSTKVLSSGTSCRRSWGQSSELLGMHRAVGAARTSVLAFSPCGNLGSWILESLRSYFRVRIHLLLKTVPDDFGLFLGIVVNCSYMSRVTTCKFDWASELGFAFEPLGEEGSVMCRCRSATILSNPFCGGSDIDGLLCWVRHFVLVLLGICWCLRRPSTCQRPCPTSFRQTLSRFLFVASNFCFLVAKGQGKIDT